MNNNFRVFLFFVLLLTTKQVYADNKKNNIIVSNQEDFDALPTKLAECVKSELFEVNIDFKKGIYFFGENFLTFGHNNFSQLSLTLKGNGSLIISQGMKYNHGDQYNKTFSIENAYISETGESLDFWSDMKVVYNEVQVLDKTDNKCRLYAYGEANLNSLECVNTYVCMSQWYKGAIYKVEKIEDNFIYFTASDLKFDETQKRYNVNYDGFYFGSPYQRYKLCNINDPDRLRIYNNEVILPSGIRSVYETSCTNFINATGLGLKKLVINGFIFNGNSSDDNMSLLYFYHNQKVLIENCIFSGIKSTVIKIGDSDNIAISDCSFRDCWGICIDVDNPSKNIIIINNTFENIGKNIASTSAVRCGSGNFIIRNNKICNFGYIAISTGAWWGNKNAKPVIGVIENNEIYLTEEYYNHPEQNSMMDGGAIYVATQNENTIIRYNNIHDINGVKDNRGIFCDDGARGVKIYNNIITNIANSWAIDSRRVSLPDSLCGATNVNNEIYGNIIEAGIRFEAREGENGCIKGVNFILPPLKRESKYSNISDVKDDVVLDGATAKHGVIRANKLTTYRMLRHTSFFKRLKSYIKKK